jgi:hypothetical protein
MCKHCRDNEINPEFEFLLHTENENEYELLPEFETYTTTGSSETATVQAAIARGERNENTLTDLVFYARHPELNRKPLSASMPGFSTLSGEWIRIRDTMVRPALSAPSSTPTPPPGSYYPAPSGGSGKLSRQSIYNAMARKRYIIYQEPYRLNIVGVRSAISQPNSFDDSINVFFKDNRGSWQFKSYPATTDPGTFWLLDPKYPSGTAILKPGQYKDAYETGLHRGSYEALVQRGLVTVILDADRNNVFDFRGRQITGSDYGINIHRASSTGTSTQVNEWSAGCQVIANYLHFNELMALARQHRNLYGNKFTYTLLEERDL